MSLINNRSHKSHSLFNISTSQEYFNGINTFLIFSWQAGSVLKFWKYIFTGEHKIRMTNYFLPTAPWKSIICCSWSPWNRVSNVIPLKKHFFQAELWILLSVVGFIVNTHVFIYLNLIIIFYIFFYLAAAHFQHMHLWPHQNANNVNSQLRSTYVYPPTQMTWSIHNTAKTIKDLYDCKNTYTPYCAMTCT